MKIVRKYFKSIETLTGTGCVVGCFKTDNIVKMTSIEMKWKLFANNICEVERKEAAVFRINSIKMNRAMDIAYNRLINVPHATKEMLRKIMSFTICVHNLIDSDELYEKYLPHLKREIGVAMPNKDV